MKIFRIIFLAIICLKCVSMPQGKKYFKLIKAVSNTTGKETKVVFTIEKLSNVVFDSIYYQNQVTKALVKENKICGSFFKPKLNIQLYGDAKKEFGNTLPLKKATFPFKIEKDEAIISYKVDKVIKYFKVKKLKKE